MGVQIDIKGKVKKDKLYKEKNKGPTYVPRFIILPINPALVFTFFPYSSQLYLIPYRSLCPLPYTGYAFPVDTT